MKDAVLMGGRNTLAHLPRDFDGFVRWQPANAAHQRSESFAAHKFHGLERVCNCFADVPSSLTLPMSKTRQTFGFET